MVRNSELGRLKKSDDRSEKAASQIQTRCDAVESACATAVIMSFLPAQVLRERVEGILEEVSLPQLVRGLDCRLCRVLERIEAQDFIGSEAGLKITITS